MVDEDVQVEIWVTSEYLIGEGAVSPWDKRRKGICIILLCKCQDAAEAFCCSFLPMHFFSADT